MQWHTSNLQNHGVVVLDGANSCWEPWDTPGQKSSLFGLHGLKIITTSTDVYTEPGCTIFATHVEESSTAENAVTEEWLKDYIPSKVRHQCYRTGLLTSCYESAQKCSNDPRDLVPYFLEVHFSSHSQPGSNTSNRIQGTGKSNCANTAGRKLRDFSMKPLMGTARQAEPNVETGRPLHPETL